MGGGVGGCAVQRGRCQKNGKEVDRWAMEEERDCFSLAIISKTHLALSITPDELNEGIVPFNVEFFGYHL